MGTSELHPHFVVMNWELSFMVVFEINDLGQVFKVIKKGNLIMLKSFTLGKISFYNPIEVG